MPDRARSAARTAAFAWTYVASAIGEATARSWAQTLLSLGVLEVNLYFALAANIWFSKLVTAVYLALWAHGAILDRRARRRRGPT